MIFPCDAAYTKANFGPPVRDSGKVYGSLAYLESIEKVRRLAAEYHAGVMFSHDMEFFQTMKKPPECCK